MTASSTQASWRLAIALVQELTTHWGAEIREYGVSPSGGLVFDMVFKPASPDWLVARSTILTKRRTISETADVQDDPISKRVTIHVTSEREICGDTSKLKGWSV
jgi:hypothetical protein